MEAKENSMEILKSYKNVPSNLKGSVLAIGNFDGVHRGHRAVFARAQEEAKKRDVLVGAMTFAPHPRQFFQPQLKLFKLSPFELKMRLLEAVGLDLAVVLNFDKALSGLIAEDFVKDVLVDGLGVSHVVTGYDFFFGKGRGGDPDVMRAMGKKYGFGVTIVEEVSDGAHSFSSSAVRKSLHDGNVRLAADLLGYWWRVTGIVEGGAKRGTGMGYPTANITLHQTQDLRHGIYAVRVYCEGQVYQAAAYLGTRPTFDDGAPVLEAFLFDFNDDLYGKTIEVEFIEYIRGDGKFEGEEALKKQMDIDCAKALEILKSLPEQHPLQSFTLASADNLSL